MAVIYSVLERALDTQCVPALLISCDFLFVKESQGCFDLLTLMCFVIKRLLRVFLVLFGQMVGNFLNLLDNLVTFYALVALFAKKKLAHFRHTNLETPKNYFLKQIVRKLSQKL